MKTFLSRHALIAGLFAALFLCLPNLAAAQSTDKPLEEGKEAYASTSDLDAYSDPTYTSTEADIFAQRAPQASAVEPPHWMWIVGRSAVWGGALGALLGVGAYLVTGFDLSPWIIAQAAGGGILAGAAIGLIEATFWTDNDPMSAQYNDGTPASVVWIERDLPETFELKLLQLEF